MDCGPAALAAVLAGFRRPASYRELRELCQTQVDGTSIDTLEIVARERGVDAEQVMVPVDFLLDPAAGALPCVLVTTAAAGTTHFVVVWRRTGSWVQLMDPEVGRRWVRSEDLLRDAYRHTAVVPMDAWREWAGSEEYQRVLGGRLGRLVGRDAGMRLLAESAADLTWRSLACLEAATRMVGALQKAGGIHSGQESATLIELLCRRDRAGESDAVPEAYWSVRPGSEEGTLALTGAVLVRFRGLAGDCVDRSAGGGEPVRNRGEPWDRPWRTMWDLLRSGGDRPIGLFALMVFAAGGGVVLEGLLFLGLVEVWARLGTAGQRWGAAGVLIVFLVLLLLVECGVGASMWRFGRWVELRFRALLLATIPRIPDRYFQSRPVSDMAHRLHLLYQIRPMLFFGGRLAIQVVQLGFTCVALLWISPRTWPVVLLSPVVILLLPWLLLPVMEERDLRVRTHAGGLTRFYLDALLGLRVVRAHAAEESLRREHDGMLVEWMRASYARDRIYTTFTAVQGTVSFLMGCGVIWLHVHTGGAAGITLLVGYWAISLNAIAGEVGNVVHRIPAMRNTVLRALDFAASGESASAVTAPEPQGAASPGIAVRMRGVSVVLSGHTVLEDVQLDIEPGEHVAIVGQSGAGKSSLLGLLLGWHHPASGRVEVDGEVLDAARLTCLRRETAWGDPAVHIWNRSLAANLIFGNGSHAPEGIGAAVEAAELREVLDRLPGGLQQMLGEGGGLLSGGEGQRVRIARALLRARTRLVILDESLRGLDSCHRVRLLSALRQRWRRQTLVCVTHDMEATRDFDKVVVVEAGRIVEVGAPGDLLRDPESRYRAAVMLERQAHGDLWKNEAWRVLRLSGGALEEVCA
jgi:ABC-type bacteriocin/lantibiotic exporter with double-glycine peptidase domain